MKAPIISIILGINVLISFLAFERQWLFRRLLLSPMKVIRDKEWERLITHGFIHGGFLHLVINMFVLWVFGSQVETIYYQDQVFGKPMGAVLLIALFFGALIAASLPSLKKQAENPHYRAVGASGAVAAVLFTYILFKPTAGLIVFPIPVPLPAFLVAILYLIYERYMEKRGGDNVAHDAHFWGATFGVAFTVVAKPSIVPAFFHSVGEYFQKIL